MFLINLKYNFDIAFNMTKCMWVNFNCPCVKTLSGLIAWYTPTWNIKIHRLYELVVYINSQRGNERWQIMSNLLNLLMRLALVHKLGWLQVSSKSFALYFLKGTYLGICGNGIFCTWARLFVFLASYLPNVTPLIYSRSYQILDLL